MLLQILLRVKLGLPPCRASPGSAGPDKSHRAAGPAKILPVHYEIAVRKIIFNIERGKLG